MSGLSEGNEVNDYRWFCLFPIQILKFGFATNIHDAAEIDLHEADMQCYRATTQVQ